MKRTWLALTLLMVWDVTGVIAENETADTLINISLDDVKISDVVKMFYRIGSPRVRYEVPEDELDQIRVTVGLRGVPWRFALEAITESVGLTATFQPNGILVISKAKPITPANPNDPAWRHAFQSILAAKGYVMIADPDSPSAYTVLHSHSDAAVARKKCASAAVSLARAVLSDLSATNVPAATMRLNAYLADNADILTTLSSAGSATNGQPKTATTTGSSR